MAQSQSPYLQIPMAWLPKSAALMAAQQLKRLRPSPRSRAARDNSSTEVLVINPKGGVKLAWLLAMVSWLIH